MSSVAQLRDTTGPFRADQLLEGEYELSNGHPVRVMPAGDRHGQANLQGGAALASDPDIDFAAGVDTGIEFNDGKNLRAPDLVFGGEGKPGWSKKIPALAVEYADKGQDEKELVLKIDELLTAGVRYLWVVRLTGPQRVEVYQPGKKMKVVDAEGTLSAPGVLRNEYPVRMLFDKKMSRQVILRNLLQSEGYESLDEIRAEGAASVQLEDLLQRQAGYENLDQVRDEGEQRGLREGVYDLCEVLGIDLSAARRKRVEKMGLEELRELRQRLKADKSWPRGV